MAGQPDPDYAAHAFLAPLAAEHITAILPVIGEERIRAGAVSQVSAAFCDA